MPGLDVEARGLADAVEQRGFGRRHPHLAAPFEPVEQRRAPAGIEVGGDLVEQQDRRRAAAFRDQLGVGEDQAQQQRLLLAGRALRGRHALGAMGDGEVLAVRADGRAPGCGVAAAAGLEIGGEVAVGPALERQLRGRKIAGGRVGEPFVQRRDGPRSRLRNRRAMLGHARFQRRQPGGVGAVGLGEQFVAGAHRRFVAGGMVGVAGLERQHQPVEEAPPRAGAVGEQPVHRRGQPQDRQPFAQAN